MSNSDPQFTVRSFPRGVKLTSQAVWNPAQDMATALSNAAVTGQPQLVPFKQSWTFTMDSETFGADPAGLAPNQLPRVTLPMIFPPPQTVFDATTQAYTSAPRLTELCVSMDQRANPYGITDEWTVWPVETPDRPTTPFPGYLTDADMSRYDTVLTLIQKVPTCFDVNGNSVEYQEVLTLTLPGLALFGTPGFNPYVVDGLSQYINPYGVYYWLVSVPGLAGLTGPDVEQHSALIVTGTPAGGTSQQYDCKLHLVAAVTGGNTFTLGTTGGGPYVFVASITDGQQDIVSGLLALAAGNTLWNFTDGGNYNGGYVPPGTGHIIATYKTVGPTADTVTAALSNVADGTFTATAGPAGTTANTLAVNDGTHTYTYVLQAGDTLATASAGLAAAINNNNGYTALYANNVISVSNLPGVAFAFTDTSSNSAHALSPCYIFFEIAYALLAMPNFNLTCMFKYPLEPRDFSASTTPTVDPYLQNVPTKHLGQPQTGTLALPTQPAGNALITGDDVQTVVTDLEAPILDKLRAGYGRDPGSEADTFPWEQLSADAGYQAINVQMFPNWWDVRGSSINPTGSGPKPWRPEGVGFPYLSGSPPYQNPVCDQRIIRVPTGFVLHHVVVAQNGFPYPKNRVFSQGAQWGNLFTTATLTHRVGVALYNGLSADDQSFQQVAFMQWTDTTGAHSYAPYLVDRLKLDQTHANMLLLNCPLVWPNTANGGKSYGGTGVGTGKPFWMGAGNSTTQGRTQAGQMPANFGGGAMVNPSTSGGENLLILRWSIQDAATFGLAGNPETVLTGPGGHHIILIGKQSTVGADVNGKVVSGNAAIGGW